MTREEFIRLLKTADKICNKSATMPEIIHRKDIYIGEDARYFARYCGGVVCLEIYNRNWVAYEEPKPKVKVAPYECLIKLDGATVKIITEKKYQDDRQASLNNEILTAGFIRRTDLEVEVEK